MVLRINRHKSITDYFALGAETSCSIVDKICACMFSFLPIFQHYKGPIRSLGFTILALLSPFFATKVIILLQKKKARRDCLTAILPLIAFEIYSIIAHLGNLSSAVYIVFMTLMFLFISIGAVNAKTFIRTTLFVCKLTSVCLIIQYISYYLFHHHIKMIPVSLLLEGSDIWINRAIMGISRSGELYRPSAFFLEPSHFYLYSFPILCFLLLSPKPDLQRIKDAVLVSLGMLLSTSGFSVVTVIMIWSIYFILYKNNVTSDVNILKLLSPRSLLIIVFMMAAVVVAYFNISIFQSSVSRIFNTSSGTSIAISGRVRLANEYIRNLHGSSLLFGSTNRVEGFEFNMAGFHATLYKSGIIGVILTYWFYAQGLFKLKGAYFYLSVLIIITSFFSAHTHGTFYMMYYTLFLMNGIYMRRLNNKQKSIAMNYGVC